MIITQAPFVITQGAKFSIPFWLKNPDGSPFDLTSVTTITSCVQNDDGTETMYAIGTPGFVINATPKTGGVVLSGTAAQSLLFAIDANVDITLLLSSGGDPVPCTIPNCYSVVSNGC